MRVTLKIFLSSISLSYANNEEMTSQERKGMMLRTQSQRCYMRLCKMYLHVNMQLAWRWFFFVCLFLVLFFLVQLYEGTGMQRY